MKSGQQFPIWINSSVPSTPTTSRMDTGRSWLATSSIFFFYSSCHMSWHLWCSAWIGRICWAVRIARLKISSILTSTVGIHFCRSSSKCCISWFGFTRCGAFSHCVWQCSRQGICVSYLKMSSIFQIRSLVSTRGMTSWSVWSCFRRSINFVRSSENSQSTTSWHASPGLITIWSDCCKRASSIDLPNRRSSCQICFKNGAHVGKRESRKMKMQIH